MNLTNDREKEVMLMCKGIDLYSGLVEDVLSLCFRYTGLNDQEILLNTIFSEKALKIPTEMCTWLSKGQ